MQMYFSLAFQRTHKNKLSTQEEYTSSAWNSHQAWDPPNSSKSFWICCHQ